MAVPFLLISPDARAGGMGDGNVALCRDANAMHWNLANLAFVPRKTGLSLSYLPWLRALVPDVNFASIAFYTKPDTNSAIGMSMKYFTMGNVVYTSPTGATIGQFRPVEFAFDIGYSRRIGKQIAVGLTSRLIRSNVTNGITVAGQDSRITTAFGFDLSFAFHSQEVAAGSSRRQFSTGLALSNLGPKVVYGTAVNKVSLPTKLAIAEGISWIIGLKHALAGQVECATLFISDPVYNAVGMPQRFTGSAGAEYIYNNTFKVRTGYFYEADEAGGRQYVTLGAGIRYNVFELDFAYLIPSNGKRSPLENTLRFSLLFSFDKISAQPRPHD